MCLSAHEEHRGKTIREKEKGEKEGRKKKR